MSMLTGSLVGGRFTYLQIQRPEMRAVVGTKLKDGVIFDGLRPRHKSLTPNAETSLSSILEEETLARHRKRVPLCSTLLLRPRQFLKPCGSVKDWCWGIGSLIGQPSPSKCNCCFSSEPVEHNDDFARGFLIVATLATVVSIGKCIVSGVVTSLRIVKGSGNKLYIANRGCASASKSIT